MGFRYNRRIKIAPGVHLNLGKKGHSWSFGKRGMGSVNYNPKTKKVRKTVDTGIKGLYWTEQSSTKKKTKVTNEPASKGTTIFGLIIGGIVFILIIAFFSWIISIF
ncbi:MAG: DUF4236 domain-containing protein [Sporolactobacillus sp.]